MITLTRRRARRLRGVFRRSALGIAHKGPLPPLVLLADGAQLRARYRYAALALEHIEPGHDGERGAIALPLDALAELEGRDESPVVLEAATPGRTVARWHDRGGARSREYLVPAFEATGVFPGEPASWSSCPTGLLDALAEAAATGTDVGTRYALGCIRLRGGDGTVAATDGRQLLVQGGFAFPWAGDVLIRRSPVFACPDLPRDLPFAVGRTDTHVVLRVGVWTLHLEVQADARYPRLDDVVPDARAATTRLRLDPGDAAFLVQAMDRLPGADEANGPVTLDLNGEVAVRARGADPGSLAELVLERSSYSGTPVRLCTDRALLGRAARLGFGELAVVDADSPIVVRDGRRVYCWQPLSKESALEPADDATRIASDTEPTTSAATARPPEARTAVSERPTPMMTRPASPDGRETSGPSSPDVPGPTTLAALIAEAEGLQEGLSDARARASRLVAALRRYRKRERLMAGALASLRQLKLQEVAG